MLLVLNLPLVGLWVRLLAIPQPWLYAGILVFAAMGTVAAKPSVVELGMLFVFGFLRLPDAPLGLSGCAMIVGLILGPMAETQLRRAMQITLGDPMVFFENPGSATLLSLSAMALLAPFVMKGLSRFRTAED